MFRKTVALVAAILLLFSCAACFAEGADYDAKMKELKAELKTVSTNYVQDRKDLSKVTKEKIKALGKTAEDKKTQKAILEDKKSKQKELLQTYKDAKKAVIDKMKALREEKKETKKQAKSDKTVKEKK
ncbi:MAG: hypothetical protein ABIH74_01690 [Candidatus Omnitrophota bacterium]